MKKMKLICLASILVSGIANAGLQCNGFKVTVRNDLAEDLEVKAVTISNATLQPGSIPVIQANTEQVFTVNNTGSETMAGEFVLQTKSSQPRDVTIKYTLKNKALRCNHDDKTPEGVFAIEKDRSTGEIKYTIKNK